MNFADEDARRMAAKIAYDELVERKMALSPSTGITDAPALHPDLFPFQRDLVTWALRRGRAAIFADTGLGKTRMQVEWAARVREHTGGSVLILAPLAVADQTVREAATLGVVVRHARDMIAVDAPGIYVTNYDRMHRFVPSAFIGVVLDESSIIKHHDAKTLRVLLDAFAAHRWKLCATATPSPNDYTELGTHAEFLGVCTRAEMLAEFFVHDGGETQKWRLKGHARAAFWRWVSSWGALIRRPEDLGYADSRYELPPVSVHQHTVPADQAAVYASGRLFADDAGGLGERQAARRATVDQRVAACARLVNADDQPWVVWCRLNSESEALAAAIDGAVEVRGSHEADDKERRLVDFAGGRARVIVTKPSIAGFGLNWQHCARVAFVGVDDSFESYYQAVRRCWRFGQMRPVHVHIFASELEGAVVANLQRKEDDARQMAEEMARETRDTLRSEVRGMVRSTNVYRQGETVMPAWLRSEGT